MKKSEKILYVAGFTLLLAIITAAAAFSFLVSTTRRTSDVVYIAGVASLTVDSNSMAPVFDKGDLIFVSAVDPRQLQVGDVACFRTQENGQSALNTHRIVSITEQDGKRYYVTRGDNMRTADRLIHAEEDVVGIFRDQRLDGAGQWMNLIASGFGVICFILLPLILFLLIYIYNLGLQLHKMKQAERAKAAATTLLLACNTWQEADRVRAEADSVWAKLGNL